ncbi:hypothetical protein JCM10207_003197 [Rhodosporidiobolus poonsookiae]
MASHSPYDGPSYPNPNVQGNPYIYLAVYSSVAVYEMMVRGIGVMRRRQDSWLNATQILKVAGVDKGKRTKILEKDIAQGVHEKVQGGYGRYQGTWIPFERAVELANAYGVSHLLAPLFDYTAPPPPVSLGGTAPPPPIQNPYAPQMMPQPPPLPAPPMQQMPSQQHAQDANAILHQARQQGLLPAHVPQVHAPMMQAGPSGQSHKRMSDAADQEDLKRIRLDHSNGLNGYGAAPPAAPSPVYAPPPPKPLSNFRTSLTFASKSPVDLLAIDPSLLERNRTALKSIFAMEGASPDAPVDLSGIFPPDLDPDTPIDDNLHTALHWAAALARTSLVRALVAFGADIHRGNNVGETPLIRAVLVTNNSDQDSFLPLLDVLGPSLRTVDDVGRSVLHHAALVAGVKGRATSARYYLETVLEHAVKQGGQFADLINAQDAHGDTALNIAARVGNRSLVRALLDAGADKLKPNKLGLRPTDYGVDDEELALNPAEQAIAAIQQPSMSDVPAQASQDVLRAVNDAINSVRTSFDAELASKTSELETQRQHLQELTRQLAEQRKLHRHWRDEVTKTQEQEQRVKNLQNAIDDEDLFDWTGRTEVDGAPATPLAGPSFTYRGPGSTLTNLPAGIAIEFDADPPVPSLENGATGEALVHLLRLQAWHERVEGLTQDRIRRLDGGNAELEGKLRRLVASVANVDEDKVDGMLEGLVRSLETDPSAMDLPRVAGFLSRIKDGSLA